MNRFNLASLARLVGSVPNLRGLISNEGCIRGPELERVSNDAAIRDREGQRGLLHEVESA